MALSDRQKRFVELYLTEPSAKDAYIKAGYEARGNSAEVNAARLLRNAQVQVAIEAAQAAREERTQVDQDWVIRRLVENVERAMQAVPVLDADGNPTGEYKYAGNVANKALELLGRQLGMFAEKHEVEHSGQVAVSVYIPANGRDAVTTP